MIELDELRNLVHRNDIEEIMAAVDEQPALLNHVFESRSHRTNLLKLAIYRNNPELLRILFDRGATFIEGGEFRNNPIENLLASARYDDPPSIEILKDLLGRGVEFPVKDEQSCHSFIRNSMESIYSYDFVDTLKAIIQLGFNPVAAEKSGKVSMIAKVLEGHYRRPSKIAEVLLEQGCSVDALERDYYSPLDKAMEMELYRFAAKLLQRGASFSSTRHIMEELADHPKIPAGLRDELTKNQDFNGKGERGLPAIHVAVEYDNSEYVSYLIDNGVDVNLKSNSGTPLIYAITCNRKKMIKHLMALGADVNAMNGKQETALDIAQSLPGFKHVCSLMTKAGAKTRTEMSVGQDQKTNVLSSFAQSLPGFKHVCSLVAKTDAEPRTEMPGSQDQETIVLSSIDKAIQAGETWANVAREALQKLSTDDAILWSSLIRHCLDNNSSKPSNKWLKEASVLLEGIGETVFRAHLLQWFPLVKEKRVSALKHDEYDDYYSCGSTDHVITENNTRLLRGLVWLSSRFDDDEMSRTLRDFATQMYKKVYGVGMRNAKLGNAALYSLSVMPGTVGLKEIIVMRAATRYNPALVNINRVFDKLAEASGKTPDEMAELSIPDYGLTGFGEFRQQVGEFEAVANLISVGKCELLWTKGDNTQKSVPAKIKSEYADDIKSIKGIIKDVQIGCAAHSLRLEQMYLRRKSLDFDTWQEQYVDHKLIGFLARRLIWRISSNGTSDKVIHTESGYIDHTETSIKIPADAIIDLWHPSMSAPEETRAWRNLLIDMEITQPFKQAHREIYLLTDAERATRNYSLRFSNHILKHSQFHALATQRGWHQQRGGGWDGGSENSASKHLPAFNMNVSFEAEGAESYDFSDTGIYECVATREVVFSHNGPVGLETVDPLLFSEVMRDVDLFVGVTSIGNDPDWRDRENQYWVDSSFGELAAAANTRKEVLTALIPKLKIANQLSIDGRFLIVEGQLTTYKIHLGSSNILMAPDDCYLCIVEVRSRSTVMLPFEGDHILSLILSKAMMLANDSKIKDKVILSQIRSERD